MEIILANYGFCRIPALVFHSISVATQSLYQLYYYRALPI